MVAISKSLARTMTGIEWADFTLNAWIGCTRVPASSGARSGCDICYAETYASRRLGVTWGAGQPRRWVSTWPARLARLDRAAQEAGVRFSVFAFSLADWLDPEVDPDWRRAFSHAVTQLRAIDVLLLTHRPHLWDRLSPWGRDVPPHVWPGVTVDHERHVFRWRQLRDAVGHTGRAWVSAEPWSGTMAPEGAFDGAAAVILGGASNTRDPAWALSIETAQDAVDRFGDRLFFKQWGVWDERGLHVGDKKAAGRAVAGRTYDRTPWPLNRDMLRAAAGRG